MNRTIITLTLCILAFTTGCGDAFDAPTAPELTAEDETALWSTSQVDVIERMARSMATALADPLLREALYEEAAEEYTGDTEALYTRLAAKQVGGITWKDRLNVDARPKHTDRLHFYVYGIEYSSPGEAPLVAVGVEDDDAVVTKAFDSQGNEYELDAQTPPTQTVVVVGLNERLDENGEPRKEFLDPGPEIHKADDCNLAAGCPGDPGGGGGGGGGPGGVLEDYREAPHREMMDLIYLYDDNESWIRGDPEIMMQMNVVSVPAFAAWQGAFPDVNEERVWYDVDQFLFNWRRSPPNNDHGAMAAVMWWEEDGGDPISVKVSGEYKGARIEFSFQLHKKDDKMGSAFVNWEDNLYTYYDTGELSWKHK